MVENACLYFDTLDYLVEEPTKVFGVRDREGVHLVTCLLVSTAASYYN